MAFLARRHNRIQEVRKGRCSYCGRFRWFFRPHQHDYCNIQTSLLLLKLRSKE